MAKGKVETYMLVKKKTVNPHTPSTKFVKQTRKNIRKYAGLIIRKNIKRRPGD